MNRDLRRQIARLHAGVCSALSDATRISILYELDGGVKTVGQLAADLELTQTTASRHLKVLRDHALVEAQREGTTVLYRLSDRRVIRALDLLREILATSLAERKALAEAMK